MTTERFLVDRELNDEFAALLENGGRVPLKVTGTSMLPLLSPRRSIVVLVGNCEKTLRRGDILLFRRNAGEGFILHRLRRILPDGHLIMNGDAQSWCEIIDRSKVIARVEEIQNQNKIYKSDGALMRIYNIIWYPTLRFRPMLLKFALFLRKEFSHT